MKLSVIVVGVLVLAWLALWGTNTGLLVYSASTKVPTTRECRYLIGVSLVTRYSVLADRCELISRTR
jgi:hypothetical protein